MSIDRRALLIAFASLALAGTSPAAAQVQAFDASTFEAAQDAGEPILVHVTAPWCGVCRAQKPIVSGLMNKPAFKDFAAFNVDFDSQKDALRRFGVRYQTALIVFKGHDEMGRSLGDTDPESIAALLKEAL